MIGRAKRIFIACAILAPMSFLFGRLYTDPSWIEFNVPSVVLDNGIVSIRDWTTGTTYIIEGNSLVSRNFYGKILWRQEIGNPEKLELSVQGFRKLIYVYIDDCMHGGPEVYILDAKTGESTDDTGAPIGVSGGCN